MTEKHPNPKSFHRRTQPILLSLFCISYIIKKSEVQFIMNIEHIKFTWGYMKHWKMKITFVTYHIRRLNLISWQFQLTKQFRLKKSAQCIMSSRLKSGTFIAVLFWPNLPRRHFLRPARLSRVRQLVISTCTSPHFFACDFTFLSTGDNVESNIS